jgi:hypothetical protein
VTLVDRAPAGSTALFHRRGRQLTLPAGSVLVLTSGAQALVMDAPLLFVGRGGTVPPRNELAGRIAVLLDGADETGTRQDALLAGGAAAVLTVLDGERTLEAVAARRSRSGYALASDTLASELEGFITAGAFDSLLRGSPLWDVGHGDHEWQSCWKCGFPFPPKRPRWRAPPSATSRPRWKRSSGPTSPCW